MASQQVPSNRGFRVSLVFRRLLAFFIDVATILVIKIAIGVGAFKLTGGLPIPRELVAANGQSNGAAFQVDATAMVNDARHYFFFWAIVLMSVAGVIYTIGLDWKGRTLGKKLMGLKVHSLDGGRPNFLQAVLRNVLKLVEFAFWPVTLAIMAFANGRRLGDLMAGTRVDLASLESSAPPSGPTASPDPEPDPEPEHKPAPAEAPEDSALERYFKKNGIVRGAPPPSRAK